MEEWRCLGVSRRNLCHCSGMETSGKISVGAVIYVGSLWLSMKERRFL